MVDKGFDFWAHRWKRGLKKLLGKAFKIIRNASKHNV